MAQVLSRIAAAAQAWQQTGTSGQPGGKAKAAGNPQAATAAAPDSGAYTREQLDAGRQFYDVGPGAGVPIDPVTGQYTPEGLQDYYNSTLITRGGITATIAEFQRRSNEIYDALDPTPRIGEDGYTQRDFLDDVKRDNQAADVLQTAARRNKSRRKDPQVAIAEDEAGRGRRRRTLAALGTRKSSAGSGVLGGGGQPGQAVRPGRTSAASVLG